MRLLAAVLLLAFELAQSSADGRPALERAAALVQQGRLVEADEQARLALANPETRAVATSILGTIRIQQQRPEEALRYFEDAIRLEPRLLGAHLSLAQLYATQGNPARATAVFARVMELDPRLDVVPQDWCVGFALLLADKGVVSDAIGLLERMRQLGRVSYELTFNLAGLYLLANQPGRALDAYDAALAIDAGSLPTLRHAAEIAEHEGQLERALSYRIRARKIAPENADVLLGFGRVCLKMDLLDDAEPALTRAAALKPDDVTAQYTLAAAKVGKREFEAAQALLARAAERHPDDSQLQYAVGAVHYVQGHLDEAAAHLRESLRLKPSQVTSPYYLALIDRDRGDIPAAIAALEALLARHPDHAASHEVLGGLLMSAQRYPDAERQLRDAIRLEPSSVKANYQLGLLLARMGRKDEAAAQLELTKGLRQEQEARSRLQLRLIDPEQIVDREPPEP